jgi:Flp pilus assembly protein TadD
MKTGHPFFAIVLLMAASPAFAGSGMDQLPNGPDMGFGRQPSPVYHRDDYGICIDRKQDTATRVRHCRAAMAAGRDAAKIQDIIGTIYSETGQFDLAGAAFDRALEAEPDDSVALNGRCRAQILTGKDPETAAHNCESAQKRDSDSAESLENQGLLQFRQNDTDAALQDFNSAIRKSVRSPYAFYLRGIIKRRTGNAPDGDGDIRTALAFNPNIPAILAAGGFSP